MDLASNPIENVSSIRGVELGGSTLFQTDFGSLILAPRNNGFSHFVTDRAAFYFNTSLHVAGGNIGSQSADLNLQTDGTDRIKVLSSNGNVGNRHKRASGAVAHRG